MISNSLPDIKSFKPNQSIKISDVQILCFELFVYVSENFKTTTLPDYDIDEKCQLWKKREKYFFIGFENKLLIGNINMVFIS